MKMYIKINESGDILGHDYKLTEDCTIEIEPTRLVNNEGVYKYKYVDGQLVELTEVEIDVQPIYLRNKALEKIEKIYLKEDKKAKADKYKEVKKDPSLTAGEIAICDEIIAELEA